MFCCKCLWGGDGCIRCIGECITAKTGISEVQCRCTVCGRMTTLKMAHMHYVACGPTCNIMHVGHFQGGHPTTYICMLQYTLQILKLHCCIGLCHYSQKGFFGLQCRKPACMCSGASKTCMLPQKLSKFQPCPITRAWQLRGAPHLKPKLQGVSVEVVG